MGAPLGINSTEAELRHAVWQGDNFPEMRSHIIKTLCAHAGRPDLVPFSWAERTTTPISLAGQSWYLPDANGVVHEPDGEAAYGPPMEFMPVTGSAAQESQAEAVRAGRAALAAVPGEIARLRSAEELAERRHAKLERVRRTNAARKQARRAR